jgi:hypothetical protein
MLKLACAGRTRSLRWRLRAGFENKALAVILRACEFVQKMSESSKNWRAILCFISLAIKKLRSSEPDRSRPNNWQPAEAGLPAEQEHGLTEYGGEVFGK